ncbi:signal peptidase I [Oleisolibacter albus]|uniref:signal peptidase I n=1 Tax=Oleisolibacter albus TaxID=2171757 RepID=UPI000DF1BB25|nr:signal peptidase I [Oleisolibacter albus]
MKTTKTATDAGWGETIKTVVYAILIAFGIRTIAFEPFNIPSGSMIPTLLVGDYLFVSKFSYGYSRYSLPSFLVWGDQTPPRAEDCKDAPGRLFGRLPERGDVAVFKLPRDPKQDYIKRIVGLPCDRIQVIGGILHVNGAEVALQPSDGYVIGQGVTAPVTVPRYLETLPNGLTHSIIETLGDNGPLDNTPVFVVPPGYVFGMGDNRDNSLDSRTTEVGFIPVENLVGPAQVLFFSLDEGVRFWEFWKWPRALRLSRMGQGIH